LVGSLAIRAAYSFNAFSTSAGLDVFTSAGFPLVEEKRFETFSLEKFRVPPEFSMTQPERQILVRSIKIARTGVIRMPHWLEAII
jgi:hypothetical protein